jgi:enhancing lycopene biosynthesis protein 2
VKDFDGLMVPGGFGAAKNLSDFAIRGTARELDPSVLAFCTAFAKAGKPAGYICIAPTLVSAIYGKGVKVTIGHDQKTAEAITTMGGIHQDCDVNECCVDAKHKVATCPAFMLANSISEAQAGIDQCVKQVVAWA